MGPSLTQSEVLKQLSGGSGSWTLEFDVVSMKFDLIT